MAGAGTRRGRYALSLLQGFLWLVVVASAACLVIITFMRPTDWYSTNLEFSYIRNNMTIDFPGDVPVPTTTAIKGGKNVTVLIGRDVPLWAGGTAFPVTLQWGSVMIAALAAAGLQQLARMQSNTQSSSPGAARLATGSAASVLMHRVCGVMTTMKQKVRRVCSTQIPPVRFWSWWCGGLSVMDAFLVLLWCGLAVVYLYYNISRKFKNTAASLTPPPAPPPVFRPPVPPPAALNASINATAPPAATSGPVVDLVSPLFMYKRLENCGKSSGEALRGLMLVMFLPISRSNFLKWLCGTDYPTLIKYHRWMSWGTMIIVTFHSLLYMIQWGAEGTLDHELSWADQGARRNVAGLIATIAGLVMAFTSTTWFRATYFWLFYKTHITGFLVFTIFSFMHYKALINWILPGLVLYAIDRAFRAWQLATNWTVVGPEDVVIDGNMLTVQLTWAQREGQTIAAGQEVYLRCPSISLFTSHPFSVADVMESHNGTTHVILHMLARGPWTTALKNRMQQGRSIRMQVEGPYQTTCDHVPTTPVVVMVAGGIGVTPLLGLLHRFVRQHTAFLARDSDDVLDTTTPAPKVYLVWSSRRLSELKLFGHHLLATCTSASTNHSPSGSMARNTPDYVPPQLATHTPSPGALPSPGFTAAKQQSGTSDDLDPTSQKLFGSVQGWLHAMLHYTGFELEQRQLSVELDVADKADKAEATPTLTRRELAAHPAQTPYLYAICIVFGFFGAWAGMLAVSYYDGYWSRTTAEGADYLAVGVLQFVFIAAGGILAPMLVLAVHWAVRRCTTTSASSLFEDTVGHSPVRSKGQLLGSYLHDALTVLPGYILAPSASKLVGASDIGMPLRRGRPDLQKVLDEVLRAHPDLEEIEVLVAGADALVESALLLCAQHNCSRAKGPALLVKRVAHHH